MLVLFKQTLIVEMVSFLDLKGLYNELTLAEIGVHGLIEDTFLDHLVQIISCLLP